MKGAYAVPMAGELKNLIAELDRLALKQFPIDGINQLLEENPLSLGVSEPYWFFSEKRYMRNLIHRAPDYEILFMCWQPHQASPVHGHEGEKCWLRVEQGQLRFVNYKEIMVNGEARIVQCGELSGGKGFFDGPAIIHSVHNDSDVPAVSLHLYARPFAQCDIFDVEKQQKSRVNLGYDSIGGKLMGSTAG